MSSVRQNSCQLLPHHGSVAPCNPVTWSSVALGWTGPLASCPLTLSLEHQPLHPQYSFLRFPLLCPSPLFLCHPGRPPEPQGGSDLPIVSYACSTVDVPSWHGPGLYVIMCWMSVPICRTSAPSTRTLSLRPPCPPGHRVPGSQQVHERARGA